MRLRPTQLFSLFLVWMFAHGVYAQSDRTVVRCNFTDYELVRNIHVDADNVKWVATARQILAVRATNFAEPLALGTGEQSVYGFRGGNSDWRWKVADLEALAKNELEIVAAYFDAATNTLLVGTSATGLLVFSTQPKLALVEKLTTANSKLKSNEIAHIFKDSKGVFWIATPAGLLSGSPGKWKSDLDYYEVHRVREQGGTIYVLADDEILIQQGSKWKAVTIDLKALEGDAIDFDLDPNGKCWILSGVVAQFDLETESVNVYSGADYYTSEFGQCIAVDADGTVWVGTQDKGLYALEKASAFTVNIATQKELSCAGGGQDGALLVKVAGGQGPYTYQWSVAGLSGDNPRNLAAGTYALTVTEAGGKTKQAKMVLEDPRPKINLVALAPESAPGKADGQAEVKVEGKGPYNFRWSNGATVAALKNLAEGSYTVTVTSPQGCQTVGSVLVNVITTELSAKINPTAPITCPDGQTELIVGVSGGKPPYQYQWNVATMAGAKVPNAAAGNYAVTITDAEGKTFQTNYTLAAPASLQVNVLIQASAEPGKAVGKAQAQSKGGTAPYTYRWDNQETGPSATKLAAGRHNLTVTDANGCSTIAVFELTEKLLPLTLVVEPVGEMRCANDLGALQAQVGGGKAPYAYRWSDSKLEGPNPRQVAPGNYQLTVTDAAQQQATGQVTLAAPAALVAQVTVLASAGIGSADGKAQVNVSGGKGPYLFNWDNGESAQQAQKLKAGSHQVTVTDANRCTVQAEVVITENILPLTVQLIAPGKIRCAGEGTAIQAQVAGGKGPFVYRWSSNTVATPIFEGATAGNYQITVTDALGVSASATLGLTEPTRIELNLTATSPATANAPDGKASVLARGGTPPYQYRWETGESTILASKLPPGTRGVTVTDANGCSVQGSVVIKENILPLSALIKEMSPIKCPGESTQLEVGVQGGKAPFQYQWSDPTLQGERPQGVKAGSYQVAIMDASGQKTSASITLAEPAPLRLQAGEMQPTGVNEAVGVANVVVAGGRKPYNYRWSNGGTTASATGLPAGTFSVTVTDGNGCQAELGGLVVTENVLPLSAAVKVLKEIKCPGETTALKVEVQGGKGPFRYQWNVESLTGDQPFNVIAGNYQVTITDATAAQLVASVAVDQPAPLQAIPQRIFGATTERSKDGRATLELQGGTGPYQVVWDNGEQQPNAKTLTLGTHTVTITDANGCKVTQQVNVGKRVLPGLTAAALSSGQTVRIEQLQFEADSARINDSSLPVLNEMVSFLQENGGIVIEVGGHTNNIPPDAFCDQLSTARAKSVADYLVAKGIDRNRVYFKGYGKRRPIATNDTPEGRRQNQRVEIKILQLRSGE